MSNTKDLRKKIAIIINLRAILAGFIINSVLISISFAGSVDVSQILINLSDSFPPIYKLVTGFAYILGIGLIFKALYHLKVYGEARTMMSVQTSMMEPISYFVVGVAFIYIPSAFQSLMETVYAYENPLSIDELPNATSLATQSLLRLIQLIGVIALVRGIYQLTKANKRSQQAGFGKAITHIIGGLIGMNIVGTMNILSASLGVNFF